MPRTARLDAPGTLHHVICHGPTQTYTDVFFKFANDRYEPYPDALSFTYVISPEIFIQKIGDSRETLTTRFLLYLAKYE